MAIDGVKIIDSDDGNFYYLNNIENKNKDYLKLIAYIKLMLYNLV